MAKDFFGNLGQALSKTAKELSGRAEDVYETQLFTGSSERSMGRD